MHVAHTTDWTLLKIPPAARTIACACVLKILPIPPIMLSRSVDSFVYFVTGRAQIVPDLWRHSCFLRAQVQPLVISIPACYSKSRTRILVQSAFEANGLVCEINGRWVHTPKAVCIIVVRCCRVNYVCLHPLLYRQNRVDSIIQWIQILAVLTCYNVRNVSYFLR